MSGDTRAIVELRKRIAASQANCPFCGYSLRGLASENCPECGKGIVAIAEELARRKSVGGSVLLAIAMVISFFIAVAGFKEPLLSTLDYGWWEPVELLTLAAAVFHLLALAAGLTVLYFFGRKLRQLPGNRWRVAASIWFFAIIGLHIPVSWQLSTYHPWHTRLGVPVLDAWQTGDMDRVGREARRLDDINAPLEDYFPPLTPLSLATASGDLELVEDFLDLGADPALDAGHGWSHWESALEYEQLEILALFIAKGHDPNEGGRWRPLLHAAALGGDLEAIELLIQAGAEIDRVYEDETALHAALASCRCSGPSLARDAAALLLIQAGADIDLPGEEGQTPLILAAAWSGPEVLQALLAAQADTTARDDEGRTALMRACLEGRPEMAAMLLEAGADANGADNGGRTPLVIAVERDQPSLVEILLQGGADPHRMMTDGTPLPQLVAGESEPATPSLRLVREYLNANQ